MTNTGGTPAGWYYAQGDPEGTQRYWDGAQWIGDPQQVQQAQTTTPAGTPTPTEDQTVQYRPSEQQSAPAGFDAPGSQSVGGQASGGFAAPEGGQTAGFPPDYSNAGPPSTGGVPPNYGVPAAPPGYQGFTPGPAVGNYAEWGTRAIALLIDWGIGLAISLVGMVLVLIGFALADALGVLMLIVLIAASLTYSIWNFCVRQGTTGQTIGKEKQGIKLVKDDSGQPVGTGMAFVRYLLAGVIGGFCGLYTILDYLWPLWDVDKKRLTDKMVTMSVVTV